MNALLASKACDITGKVGIACARHGCYAPNTLVDLFRGEQQKNVDFAFLQALETTGVDPQQGVLLIYDIACQYVVHLQDRIGHKLPTGLTVDAAIGLFHVHAHKDECFFRFASSFIPGAGIVAGEILESLWSSLNAISPTARTATLAHRAEIIDDHATDSNHKKMINLRMALCRRHHQAAEMVAETTVYHDRLSADAGTFATARWTDEILNAEASRLNDIRAMDVYASRTLTGLAKVEKDAASGGQSALEVWLEFALLVEEKQ